MPALLFDRISRQMKVLDLHCEQQHLFEGWFASEEDFLSQLSRNLVQCPLCGSAAIKKRLSAPRLNLGVARDEPSKRDDLAESAIPSQAEAATDGWMSMAKRILANTDDVGEKFADEARKIHYGESRERGIRGRATADQTQALIEEGIAVLPFVMPEALKRPLQ